MPEGMARGDPIWQNLAKRHPKGGDSHRKSLDHIKLHTKAYAPMAYGVSCILPFINPAAKQQQHTVSKL